ncbi:YggS family pyridoxal phosphate enzyme [Sulfuriferula plumbiphila]|uniref:Pyridoxal phosphate homeostasis protein n=1 Tax=Sulfuriferula plumbiphila TaxID=171865 RepID=A0A512L867_9PROT|nr:YggS family pyridoxal phosphate-dependent enzyme [Sulfuriferula plumbiphila]BBP05619.1 YggS family pyridoxal phosphate enzyme [Sulfuriferula plumbiphila]GEP30674.1 YggS family pyridoxal phosphate enzyme [Sulfuriferula plumbiphila]
MDTLKNALQAVRTRIAAAACAAGRTPDAVELLAVSKTFGVDAIRAAAAAGQRAFGESYVQEALLKIAALADLSLIWHFIGPLQRNKTRAVAEHFDWVHGVDRAIIAQRLNDARPATRPPLNVCVQVNVSGEASKSGVAPADLPALVQAVAQMPRLRLRGLMAIPAPGANPDRQRSQFRLLRRLRDGLDIPLDTLSMGMSDDLEAAIAEGATLVRVGSAIFGWRQAKT